MNKKENFYVFLDIDGVLWDWEWRKSQIEKGSKKEFFWEQFNPESMSALNHLLRTLGKKYNCFLVISSTWRQDMNITNKLLRLNGLKFDKPLLATPISSDPSRRGEEILRFFGTNRTQNFVIIDDESFDFHKYFSSDKIIKTNIFSHSLNRQDVSKYLKNALNKESTK